MRMFKVTACVPSQTRIRTQRELQNTFLRSLYPTITGFASSNAL